MSAVAVPGDAIALDDHPAPRRAWRRQLPDWRSTAAGSARLVLFAIVAAALAFPSISRIGSDIAGNPGDAYFSYWVLEWGKQSLGHLLSGYWTGPIFYPNPNTMAWSETYLAVVLPFWLLATLTRSGIVAMNLVYLLAWTFSTEWTYRLVRRITGSSPAGLVGAFAFTYSTIRLTQSGHYQLTFGAFLPLCALCALRFFDRPTPWRGVAVGGSLAALLLSAAYYAVLGYVVVAAAGCVYLAASRRKVPWRALAVGGGAALATFAVLAGSVALHYAHQQENPAYRRAYPAAYALRAGDLRVLPPQSRFLGRVSLLRSDSANRSTENYAFPGFVTLAFGLVGAAVACRSRWWRRLRAPRAGRREVLALVVAGAVALLVAIGRNRFLWVQWPVYDVARTVLPGIRSMLALVRLFLLTQLALAVLAGVGIAFALSWFRSSGVRWALAAGLAGIVLIESAQTVPMATLPTPEGQGAVNLLLRDLEPGPVVELPMAPLGSGAVYPYTENPRMVLATTDWLPRLNGYSGFVPPDYPALVELANKFPDPASVVELQRRGVRYVVLHTKPLDTGLAETTDLVNASGYAWIDPGKAAAMVRALPLGAARGVTMTDGAILVELCPAGGCA